ncbi:MAG: hypothetical protein JOZ73_11075 [Solirubrobacterales bacterium]|nr:hypothetical protein [Solirubrobacterales bacterium]
MIVARLCAVALALLVCAWFALGIRQAHDTNKANALLSRSARVAARQAPQIEDLLRSAKTLNPDSNVSVLQARVADLEHQRPRAVRILEDVVRREPMNLTAWATLAILGPRSPGSVFLLAYRKLNELDPRTSVILH